MSSIPKALTLAEVQATVQRRFLRSV